MTTLTKGEQFIYDWQYNGYESTSFKGYLSKAMAVADSQNLKALGKAFPEEALAMDNYHHTTGWWDRVQDKHNALHLIIIGDHPVQTNVATKKER